VKRVQAYQIALLLLFFTDSGLTALFDDSNNYAVPEFPQYILKGGIEISDVN
jgi:hypothetical protein